MMRPNNLISLYRQSRQIAAVAEPPECSPQKNVTNIQMQGALCATTYVGCADVLYQPDKRRPLLLVVVFYVAGYTAVYLRGGKGASGCISAIIAAALCPDSKHGEDQLPALLVPAERGDVLFIKGRYLAGDMGENCAHFYPPKTSKRFKIEMIGVRGTVTSFTRTSRPRFAAPAPTSCLTSGTGLLGVWIGALIRDARRKRGGVKNRYVYVSR